MFLKIQFNNCFPITFSFNVGRSRGVKEEETYRENCVRRNTFLNISNQLQRKDGWRLLVMQLKERMGRRDSEHPDKGLIPLREFQKYDSTFSTYLTGTIKYIYRQSNNISDSPLISMLLLKVISNSSSLNKGNHDRDGVCISDLN